MGKELTYIVAMNRLFNQDYTELCDEIEGNYIPNDFTLKDKTKRKKRFVSEGNKRKKREKMVKSIPHYMGSKVDETDTRYLGRAKNHSPFTRVDTYKAWDHYRKDNAHKRDDAKARFSDKDPYDNLKLEMENLDNLISYYVEKEKKIINNPVLPCAYQYGDVVEDFKNQCEELSFITEKLNQLEYRRYELSMVM